MIFLSIRYESLSDPPTPSLEFVIGVPGFRCEHSDLMLGHNETQNTITMRRGLMNHDLLLSLLRGKAEICTPCTELRYGGGGITSSLCILFLFHTLFSV